MFSTSRRVMLWSGVVLVFGLGLVLAYLAYCNHRAVNRLDVVGMDRRVKPTGLAPLPDGTASPAYANEDQVPMEYEYFEKRGVSEIHRVGSQVFHIASVPIFAMILVGVLLITRALSSQPRELISSPATPIDPLAD
jgi:hypothetical protein